MGVIGAKMDECGKATMNWTVYILECSDNTLYTGITKNIERRMAEHENGTGAKYTKGRAPFKVVYSELQPTMSHALKREAQIKSLDRSAKQKLTSFDRIVKKFNPR